MVAIFDHENYDDNVNDDDHGENGRQGRKGYGKCSRGSFNTNKHFAAWKRPCDDDTGMKKMVLKLVDDLKPWCDAGYFWGVAEKYNREKSTDGNQSSNRHFVQFGINLKLI